MEPLISHRILPKKDARSEPGFSLVELLLVVAFLTLTVLAVPTIQSTITSHRLISAGNRLTALMEQARIHTTVTQKIVALRFYAEPEAGAGSAFRAVRLFELTPPPGSSGADFVATALTRTFHLEEPLLISGAHSPLLQDTGLVSGIEADTANTGLTYREIYFFPDGSTSLQPASPNPYLTVINQSDQDILKNPIVVSLDPVTARTTFFQR